MQLNLTLHEISMQLKPIATTLTEIPEKLARCSAIYQPCPICIFKSLPSTVRYFTFLALSPTVSLIRRRYYMHYEIYRTYIYKSIVRVEPLSEIPIIHLSCEGGGKTEGEWL